MRNITITEQPYAWLIEWPDGTTSRVITAASALRAVKQSGEWIAKGGSSDAAVITWCPCTKVGRIVVKALQG